ncbi:ABC transporter substrate-binding protein [Chromobacterium sp. IIBBL 290-4]|uniref:substrate-binding periplasmic protein n=1 Tax=Chromobacterium sp. IIBBL 290-4 TaxID=2953890 RepID=UPI0020B76EB1|nr:transporter substrate-binding domain-containing protein [Chromobacterium sp. IIBBL 290-4]UTH76575.1 transporter substrate-binding domain-containing protein [Chromobacterium sp. IIBBL 290-4]
MWLAFLSWGAMAETLRLAATWPPYCGAKLPGGGVLVSQVRSAMAAAGFRTEVLFMPWKRVLASVASGDADGVIGAELSGATPPNVAVSVKLMEDREYLFRLKQETSAQYAALTMFHGKHVGVMRGSAVPELRAAGMVIEEADDDAANIRKLAHGHLDLMLANDVVMEKLGREKPDIAQRLQRLEPPVYRDPLYLLLSKRLRDWSDVMTKFDAKWVAAAIRR